MFGGIEVVRWEQLDAFEGPAYRREHVEVRLLYDRRVLSAQCYLRAEGLQS